MGQADYLANLIRLHQGLPRKGPGLDSCTLRALRACGPLAAGARILDLGCGAGAAALLLAQEGLGPITAVDLAEPFLAELQEWAKRQGLADRIATVCADFARPPFPGQSFDLLWSEGAIYNLGWEPGLRAWLPLLRPGGFLAITEAVWLEHDPPPEAVAAWASWYPAMTSVTANAEIARGLGLEVLETFSLPPDAWWNYYDPMQARCEEPAFRADPALAEVIREYQQEIACYSAHGRSYGYAFFILRKPG